MSSTHFCSSNPLGFFAYWFNHSCAAQYEIYEFSIPGWWEYLLLFGFTYLFETPIYYFFLRRQFTLKKIAFISLALNLFTHPLVIYAVPAWMSKVGGHEGQAILIGETFAPLAEYLMLALIFRVPHRQAFFASLCANLFSWLVGGWLVWNWIL